ncbi:MAG: NAD(P)/FAD-dependent oxidoreductase [Eubacterium sp.]|nr:NAD(P)/FAD-dependent oxidoreductase [Eubacterium sp.]MBR2278617.1 NAD(P)/FAD-dependent oxidoreductase [Eubacterium sp.]
MYDVIIIGAGPAGISASLYAKRANKSVLVLYHGESQLEKAHMIDNYYGFVGGITGQQLYDDGIKQARELGVEVKNEQVTHIQMTASMTYEVVADSATYEGKTLILATGNKKIRPNIKSVADFEGKGVSYCAICDGFFYRKKTVAVLGNGEYALSEAGDLENIAAKVYIITDGLEAPQTDKFEVITKKIAEVRGDAKISTVVFDDGSELTIDGLFVALGVAGGADFAKKLGISLDGDSIKVNADMSTNIPGVYSCGNVTGGLLQVCKAVYEGAEAGLSAVKYLKENNK